MKPLWLGFLVVVCPRVLGVEGYGVFTLALAVAGLAASFADFGMTAFTVREVARQVHRGARYVTNLTLLRMGMLVVAGSGALAAALILGYEAPVVVAVVLAAGYWLGVGVATYARAFLRAHEAFREEAVATVIERVGAVTVGAIGLFWWGGAQGGLAGMALGVGLAAAWTLRWVMRTYARFDWRLVSGAFVQKSVRGMVPLGVSGLLVMVYLRIDQVMIEAFLGNEEVAVYGLAYRFLEALVILPSIVATSVLYPRFARFAASGDDAEVRRLITIGSVGLLVVAAGVVGVGGVLAPWLVEVATGDAQFMPAGGLLRLLLWTFPLTCLSNVLISAYLAARRERVPLVALSLAVVVNVGLNAIAIPAIGTMGAVYATIAAEAVVVVVYALRLPGLLRSIREGQPASEA